MIETARLVSAPLGEDDLPFLVEMYADEQVAWGIGGTRDEPRVRERLARWMRHWDTHGWGGLMFFERDAGQRIGWGGLQHSDIDGEDLVTVGYVIRPDRWGQGYATEITVAAVAYAFDVLDLDRVFASVDAPNLASRRVLEKAGLSLLRETTHAGLLYTVAR